MPKYTINPDAEIWETTHALCPSEMNLDDFIEQLLAKEAVRNEDHPDIHQSHIKAAEHILRGPKGGGERR